MKYLRVILFKILIGTLPVHASELKSIKQNILENRALDAEGTVWNDLPLLAVELIASYLLYDHPIIPFILERVNVNRSTLRGHARSISSAEFNRTGDKVVTASDDHTARIWDTGTGQCIKRLGLEGLRSPLVEPPGFSRRRNERLVKRGTALQGLTKSVLNPAGAMVEAASQGHTSSVSSAAFNSAGDKVVTASYDKTAKIWDSTTGKCLATLGGHEGLVFSAIFNSAGDKVITASKDAFVKTWDTDTGRCIISIGLRGISSKKVSYLDSSRAKWRASRKVKLYSATLNKVGDKVVTTDECNPASIWDTTTGMRIVTFGTRGSFCSLAALNASGDKVVTGSFDKTAKIWDISGTCLTTLEGHTNMVSAAAFSMGGIRVVTGSKDNTAKLWDTQIGKCLATLTGHTGSVNSAAFNEVGDKMVTTSSDTTVKIWDISIWPKLQKFFSGFTGITLNQVVILDSIYEVIKEISEEKIVSSGQKYFDFKTYEHLQDDYDDLPQEIQVILDQYVKKVGQVRYGTPPAVCASKHYANKVAHDDSESTTSSSTSDI